MLIPLKDSGPPCRGLENSGGGSLKRVGSVNWASKELAGKKRQRLTNLWIVSQFELQSYCLSGPGDLDFFLYPICWCSAAWGGDLAAGLCGEGGLGNWPGSSAQGLEAYIRTFNGFRGC